MGKYQENTKFMQLDLPYNAPTEECMEGLWEEQGVSGTAVGGNAALLHGDIQLEGACGNHPPGSSTHSPSEALELPLHCYRGPL